MAFNDIYKLRVVYGYGSMVMMNVLHFVEDTPLYAPGTPGALALAQDFVTNMATPLKNRLSGSTTLLRVEVQPMVPFGTEAAIVDFPAGSVGALPFSAAIPFATENITIYSNQIGRRKRGRIYLPSGGDNQASVGLWLSAQTVRTQTFATAIDVRYMRVPYATSWALGIWSRVLAGPTPPWPTSAFVRAARLTVRTTVRTQRRRQIGVGR